MVALFENAQGATVSYKIDDDSLSKWRPIGQLKNEIYQVLNVGASNFTRIKFKLSGNIIGNSFIFRGFEILNASNYEI